MPERKRTSDHWSEEELSKLKAMCEEGVTKSTAANALGRSVRSVESKGNKLHLYFLREDEWRPQDIKRLKELCEAGITKTEAAEILQCSVKRVVIKVRNLGLHLKRESSWTSAEIDRLRRLADEGKTVDEIAEAMGRTSRTIGSRARMHGIIIKRAPSIPDEEPMKARDRWTKGDERLLIELHAEGNSIAQLASALGRSECAIRNRMVILNLSQRGR